MIRYEVSPQSFMSNFLGDTSKIADVSKNNLTVSYPFLFFSPDLLQPVQYAVFGACHTIAGNSISIEDSSTFLHFPDGLDGIRETAAAMRAKRNNSFAAEVVLIEER